MRESGIIDSERLADPAKPLGAYWILREGDRVLFKFSDDIDTETLETFRDTIRTTWPDVPCLIVAGDVEVTIIGPE